MILHLPVKAKWYDMQESREKPEECDLTNL